MKKPFGHAYGFKSHCTSINELFSKFEYCLQSRNNIQRNIFQPFGNEFLPPSKNISLTGRSILYPLKHADLFDYDTRCLMSSGLMFEDIIMNILRNKKLYFLDEENACFLQRSRTTTFICTGGQFKIFTGKRHIKVSRCSMCKFPY